MGFTPHVGLYCAKRQPISRTTPQRAAKPPSTNQTGLGPTLAMSYPIDGRGRPESPALIHP